MTSTTASWGAATARDAEQSVIWLEGEEDIATVAVLAETLASAVSSDDADLVVDLSGLTFLSAATISELIRVRNTLWHQNRNLVLRRPSPFARRLLDLCGLPSSRAPQPEIGLGSKEAGHG